jgi:hypothetical protein
MLILPASRYSVLLIRNIADARIMTIPYKQGPKEDGGEGRQARNLQRLISPSWLEGNGFFQR